MARPYPDTLVPHIVDDSGYLARMRDLVFLRIEADEIPVWLERSALLGMSTAEYASFCMALWQAVDRDGLNNVDARIQGSSARFFSGRHKELPRAAEWPGEFAKGWGEHPTPAQLAQVKQAWLSWLFDNDIPLRRPFDSMFRLGLSEWPSDYDVQLSSDDIVRRAETLCAGAADVFHPVFDFVNKRLVPRVCPHIIRWSEEQETLLGRSVTVAVFDSAGPPDKSGEVGTPTTHFQDDDWLVHSDE